MSPTMITVSSALPSRAAICALRARASMSVSTLWVSSSTHSARVGQGLATRGMLSLLQPPDLAVIDAAHTLQLAGQRLHDDRDTGRHEKQQRPGCGQWLP